MPPKRNNISTITIERLISQCVADLLLDYEANQNTRNRNGNRNGNGNDNGNRSHNSGSGDRRTLHTARGCTYTMFLNCQPLNFKGTEGAIGLAHWFEKIESVFHISNCDVECQVKYATCTLLGGALTWWNSYVTTVGHDASYDMPWKNLMKMMTEVYCPRSEIKKHETEMVPDESDKVERYVGGLPDSIQRSVKGTDVVSYTQRFQELALMCGRMFPEESDEVEKYVGGLSDNIQGYVMSAMPKTMQEAIELANDLIDQKVNKLRTNVNLIKTTKLNNNLPRSKMWQGLILLGLARRRSMLGLYHCATSNRNRGNQAGNSEVRGEVYALGGGETDQDPNNIEDGIEA
nr:hypothetical protein [Tanacetum cinerariifolium]